MAQNEMRAMRGMPLRVRSSEGLARILLAKGTQHNPGQKCGDDECTEAERSATQEL